MVKLVRIAAQNSTRQKRLFAKCLLRYRAVSDSINDSALRGGRFPERLEIRTQHLARVDDFIGENERIHICLVHLTAAFLVDRPTSLGWADCDGKVRPDQADMASAVPRPTCELRRLEVGAQSSLTGGSLEQSNRTVLLCARTIDIDQAQQLCF